MKLHPDFLGVGQSLEVIGADLVISGFLEFLITEDFSMFLRSLPEQRKALSRVAHLKFQRAPALDEEPFVALIGRNKTVARSCSADDDPLRFQENTGIPREFAGNMADSIFGHAVDPPSGNLIDLRGNFSTPCAACEREGENEAQDPSHRTDSNKQCYHKGVLNRLIIVFAWLCVAWGILAALIPLVPTTPFLVLGLYILSKRDPRMARWLKRRLYRARVWWDANKPKFSLG
ncbi:MAG: hypothetical protein COB53_05405 [Elusimicrobia bacterium]|nr:MAG: hypothetical protein COB53_05405 [Elusimicrobiota bacterium]